MKNRPFTILTIIIVFSFLLGIFGWGSGGVNKVNYKIKNKEIETDRIIIEMPIKKISMPYQIHLLELN